MTKRKSDPGNPSSVFFWKDYEDDERLRVCSLAAQGLWMRLLCLAAKGTDRGYILINGQPVGAQEVARLCGVAEDVATELLAELDRYGVFSRDRKGRMYSRRMVREEKTRKKHVENGKKGGNPSLSATNGKQKEKSEGVNPSGNTRDKPPYSSLHSPSSSLRSEEIGGGGSACAREADPTFRERMLAACGVDPVSGLTGHGGQMIGKQHEMAEIQREMAAHGLSEEEVLAVILEEMGRKSRSRNPGLPGSLMWFVQPILRYAAAKNAAPSPLPEASARASPQAGQPDLDKIFADIDADIRSGAFKP